MIFESPYVSYGSPTFKSPSGEERGGERGGSSYRLVFLVDRYDGRLPEFAIMAVTGSEEGRRKDKTSAWRVQRSGLLKQVPGACDVVHQELCRIDLLMDDDRIWILLNANSVDTARNKWKTATTQNNSRTREGLDPPGKGWLYCWSGPGCNVHTSSYGC
jgi:hypothetical protein